MGYMPRPMAPNLKALVKKSVKGTARRLRRFAPVQEGELAQIREELAGLRRDLELAHGSMVEASSYMGRTLREVGASLEAVHLRTGSTAHSLAELNRAEADFINLAEGHRGFAAQHGIWLNPPVRLHHEEGRVVVDGVNERIVEVPFVFGVLSALPPGSRVLDVGAAESTVSLSLASLGHRVTAVDLRGYPFEHPNLAARKEPIEGWDGGGVPFDAVILLSAIEHFGLGAYGEQAGAEQADRAAMRQLHGLLKPGGVLALTVPYGKRAVTSLERTYDEPALAELLEGFEVERQAYGEQQGASVWSVVPRPTEGERARVALVAARRR